MSQKVIDLLPGKVKKATGEVGIEIEMEGENLSLYGNTMYWRQEADNSLRGESMEYVLHKPVKRELVSETLIDLQKDLPHAVFNPSDRCGVHIHINYQQNTLDQVINAACLWLILEDVLVKWCGEDREGNLFCLRGKDADYQIQQLIHTNVNKDFVMFSNNEMRYAAQNLCSINKYGSIEYRSLRTPKNLAIIQDWVNILLSIKDAAVQFRNAKEIVEQFSAGSPVDFARRILGPQLEMVQCKGMKDMLYQGIRRIQDIAYADNLLQPMEKPKKDFNPFAKEWVIVDDFAPKPVLKKKLQEVHISHLRLLNEKEIEARDRYNIDPSMANLEAFDAVWKERKEYKKALEHAGYDLGGF